jgi:NADH/NAD ratio-sensing transcriptional regulator Rex
MKQTKIPAITINRLSFYARFLFLLNLKDVNVVSSTQLARV